ncbi:phosphonopyruvate decarboxylase-like isoform X2 [Mytilus galloprovincialis]|uniref:phosphonopyruvate decarboxylase-like isoform X2 n=1 Tax=Mytilus galloprovincialis TaxID=29158 RepID=UPI003F7B3A4B
MATLTKMNRICSSICKLLLKQPKILEGSRTLQRGLRTTPVANQNPQGQEQGNGTQSSLQEKQYEEQQRRNKEAEFTELVRDFLNPGEFYKACVGLGIDYFTGVPDSLLKDFCAYVTANAPEGKHLIAANEGNAVALASGYHLATGKHSMVYLQNSGLGNIVNPIMSLTSQSVYSIPMLLFIGWRGEPGKRDEPQHSTQGQSTPGLLAALGIPFQPLPDYQEGAEQALLTAKHYMKSANAPYALLVKRQIFSPYKLPKTGEPQFPLNREGALKVLIDCLGNKDVVISTTGMTSRELFEYRVTKDMGHEKDFLTVGSMGHASSIALGIALQKPRRQVFCLDGDGAAIMHLGSMASIGQNGPANLKHVIINNGAHDSVGGQPSDAKNHDTFSFVKIAEGCGYKQAFSATTEEEIKTAIAAMRSMDGPLLLEIKAEKGHRKQLGRPTRTPLQNKEDFMHFLAIG